jgi:iron complex outermembrane recepter protein
MDNLFQKFMVGSSTAALIAAMSAGGVRAQDQNSNADIEQVVVSASRITIAGYTQPTPVTVIGAADLEKNAFANILDSVRELPEVTAPPSNISATNGSGGGANAGENLVNLRNLGATRTLVLFDNQRVVASNITGGVDITTLPTNVISRVDVVTGGASAAWGSDAVAGVVNFVLNKNFDGFKATVQAGDTYNGNEREFTTQADWGGDFAGGRGHLILAATMDVRPDNGLLIDEKWWRGAYWVSNPAYAAGNSQPQLIVANNVGLADATPGSLIVASPKGTGATPAAANALRGIEFVGAGIPQQVQFGNVTLGTLSNGGSLGAYDSEQPQEVVSLPQNTWTFFGFGRYKLTDTIQASMQLNYGFETERSRTDADFQTAVTIQSDNAFIPASVRAAMQAGGITSFTIGTFQGENFNTSTLTPQNFFTEAEQGLTPDVLFNRRQLMRGVFTLEGEIGSDWSWATYYEYSQADIYIHTMGDLILANLTAAQDAVTVTAANVGKSNLALGSIACRSSLPGQAAVVVGGITAQAGCSPIDVFGTGNVSPSAIAYADGNNAEFGDTQLEQNVWEASMQGTLPWELPAGKIAVAFGAGYRKEAGVVNATALGVLAGYESANYSNFPSASYAIWEGFGEVDAPILKDNFVETLDFNAAGRITDYSTSGMVETWKLGLTSQVDDNIKLRTTWSVDIRAPQLNELFNAGAINFGSGKDPKTQVTVANYSDVTGNPNLVPEIARTFTAGVVLTPSFIPGLSVSADWHSIDIAGEIATLSLSTIENQCNPTIQSVIHPGQLGNPNDPLCTVLIFNGPPSPGFTTPSFSEALQEPINVNKQTTSGLDLQANYTMDFWQGSLVWSGLATLTDETTTTQPGTAVSDSAGIGGVPKWRGTLAADYTTGPYSVTVEGRWFGTSKISQTANTGNLATASTANLYPTNEFEVPIVAYLDLRASYKWNDNIQLYGAIDNATDVPPPLIPLTTNSVGANGGITGSNAGTYDELGRAFRAGIRFSY